MKKIFLILGLVLLSISCKAQNVIPIENEQSYANSLPEGEFAPDGTYFKDINKVLEKYKGFWEGIYHHNFYELKINKEKYEFYGIYKDILVVDYKITNDKGEILQESYDTGNDNVEKFQGIRGSGFSKKYDNLYRLFYSGLDDNDVFCGDSGTIYLEMAKDGKTLKLFIIPDEALISEEECPNGRFNPPFPNENQAPMVLRKIE